MRGPRTAMKSGPLLPQLEKALARTKDPTQPKINNKYINKVAIKKKKIGCVQLKKKLVYNWEKEILTIKIMYMQRITGK